MDQSSGDNNIGAQLPKGIIEGISILADGGVISPLLFADITITQAAISIVSRGRPYKCEKVSVLKRNNFMVLKLGAFI
eukprot:14088071-Ditylum_brightwellii.AAC.1